MYLNELTKKIDQSIHKTFRARLWSPFVTAIKEYQLIEENDKIAVCISGGKDSMCMAKMMQLLQRYSDFPFELVYLVMDPGYNSLNRGKIEDNARILDIPITVFETRIFDIANSQEKSPCYLCAKMRRGALYQKAKELDCNKIALGHHFDDVIETTLLGMFYASKLEGMMPKLHSTNYEGMELIRPMYKVREADIISWKNFNDLDFIQCACRFTENCTICDNGGGGSKRQEIKKLIKNLHNDNPAIEKNIFNSLHRVCIDTFPGYKKNGKNHSFLENYENEKK